MAASSSVVTLASNPVASSSVTRTAILSSVSSSLTQTTRTKTDTARQAATSTLLGGVASSVNLGESAIPADKPTHHKTPLYKTVYVTTTAHAASGSGTVGQSDLTVGAIAGIAVGGLVALIAICLLAFYLLRRRKQRSIPTQPPSSTGSRGDIVAEKDNMEITEMGDGHGRVIHEAPGGVAYELEAPVAEMESKQPELHSRSISFDSEGSPTTPTMIDSRHVMSRGRPVRRGENG